MNSDRIRPVVEGTLRLVVRTPQGSLIDEPVKSLRLPSDSGQVGLRPRSEQGALVVEPGLALARTPSGLRFVATAGGLLRCDGKEAVLLTPLAVVGESADRVVSQLERLLSTPSPDLELRGVLRRLETGVRRELRSTTSGRVGEVHG